MVIDQSRGLHMGINRGASQKFEAPLFKVFGQLVGSLGSGWDFGRRLEMVLDGFAIDKSPDIVREGSELLLHFHESFRIVNGRFDFKSIADDPCILHQFLDIIFWKFCHCSIVKVGKGLSVPFALFQYRRPA